jgi:hypothetical protein
VDVVCKQIVGKKYFLTSEQSGLIGVAAAIVLFIVISLLSSERTVSDIAVKEKEEK